ncbi:hypothetical protein EI94DRAFT_1736033 [Lactarius quietus]|nr:hypothetical protein EI94DRAFT_1736033 [Lactarius quietus]
MSFAAISSLRALYMVLGLPSQFSCMSHNQAPMWLPTHPRDPPRSEFPSFSEQISPLCQVNVER